MANSILMLIVTIMVLTAGSINQDLFEAGSRNPAPEHTIQENTGSVQMDISDLNALDAYMESVRKQSDIIQNDLTYNAVTQTDMNRMSQELRELWDEALNALWAELQSRLPEDKFAKLQDEQHTWLEEKEKRLEEAGKEFEGGSLYPLIVNGEAAEITQERVYELYELLKKSHIQ